MDYIEVSAKTIDEAIANGVAQLGAEGKTVTETKVLEQPSSGFLGIGRRPAIVRLYFEMSAPAAEAVTEEAAVEEPVVVTIPDEATVVKETIATATETVIAHGDEPAVTETVTEVTETVVTAPAAKEAAPEKDEAAIKADRDAVAAKGKQFLTDMLTKMGLTVTIEKLTSPDSITFQIHGDDLGILIGKHGQTLDAIQYLTNLVANKEVSGHYHIVVDVEHYRSRREETLMQLARRLASKVKRTRQKVSLEPMSTYERKIIHLTLQDESHIVTDSEGEEPYRHVVIAYKK